MVPYYKYTLKEPQNLILIIEAPTLLGLRLRRDGHAALNPVLPQHVLFS